MLVDKIESSNHYNTQGTYNVKQQRKVKAETVVFVDADHISFVDSELVSSFDNVDFRFYYAFGANLPYLQRLSGFTNVSRFQAPCPVSDIADVMICIDIAQTPREKRCIVVSKDKMLYNLSLLLDNVVYLSTKEQLVDLV